MIDIATRLRKVEPDAPGERTRWYRNPDGPEAADEIERLRADNDRLREALEYLVDEQNGPPLLGHEHSWRIAMEKARAALGEEK